MPLGIGAAVAPRAGVSPDVACLLTTLGFTNHSIKWVIYGLFNRRFRHGYRRLWDSLRRRTGEILVYVFNPEEEDM